MFDYHLVFPHLEENPHLPDVFDKLPTLSWDDLLAALEPKVLGQIHPTAVIGSRVSIGEGTIIHPFVVIEDDVIIGEKCEIRAHSLIRSKTVMGDQCVIGHGVELKNVFICDQAKIQGHSFVGDSIVGKGARIGTACVIANRRFDQKVIAWRGPLRPIPSTHDKLGAIIGDFVRLGAHVTTNPGSVIGAYTWVSSGNVVSGYIAEEKFVKLDGRIVPNEEAIDLAADDASGKR